MFHFLRKKSEEISRTTPGFEETERRTPKTGIILLIIMFIAGMYFGWVALDDLSRVPNEPSRLSSCSSRYLSSSSDYDGPGAVYSPLSLTPPKPYYDKYLYDNYAYYDNSSNCKYNDLETANGIPKLMEKRLPVEAKLRDVSQKYSNTSAQLNSTQRQRQDLERQYGIGLQEIGAPVDRKIFPVTPDVQNSILNLRAEESKLQATLNEYETERVALRGELKKIDEELKEAYKPVFAEHNRRLRWYEFKIFLLQFAIMFPLFMLALGRYLSLLRKNSPYSIIFTGIVAVMGILLLRVILFWFWGLFLARIIEVLWRWIQSFQLVRSIVFYFGMVLSFAIFGGAVYYLQKKIFDPRRVAIRRFRQKQCPHCQANLDLATFFCPNCGQQIKEKCASCGNARFVDLPACPYCGGKK